MLVGALVGAVFAIIPDPLQFVYMKYRHEPLISLQRFHLFMHARTRLNDRPLLGVGSQIALIAVMALLSRFIV